MRLPPSRRALLRTALSCAAAVPWHPQRALSINGLTNFQGLGNRYVLLRPGETTYDAAGMLDTNPINKLDVARGLTDRGREQVHVAARRLLERGIDTPVVWYDSGARAAQTAEILGEVLSVPRTRLVPEYSFLSARGMGALDRGNATLLLPRVRAADSETSGWAPEEAEDGTPSDSIEDVFVRVRQAVSKIETQFSGEAVILVGDSEVLSTITAAACGVELEMHGRYALEPAQFRDLRDLATGGREGSVGSPTTVVLGRGGCRASSNAADAADPDISRPPPPTWPEPPAPRPTVSAYSNT